MKYGPVLAFLIASSLVACSQQKIAITSSSTPTQVLAISTLQPIIIPTPSSTSTTRSSTPIPLNGTIVFTSTGRIYNGISLLNLQDGNIQSVTGMGSDSISWSPDSDWIAFNGGIPPAQNGGIASHLLDLFIIKSNGSEYKRLTQSFQGKGDVNWSSDGKFLVYKYDNHIQPSNLAVFDLGKETTYLLTATNGYESYPAWSPDGKQIVYLYTQDHDHFSELWLMDADGSNPKRVLDFKIAFSRIDWSPDGQWIAFISAKNSLGCGDVHRVRPDGTELTQLTNLPGCALNVIWSPDGKHLAYIEQKDYFNNFKEWQSQISIIDILGKIKIVVTLEETRQINDIDWQLVASP